MPFGRTTRQTNNRSQHNLVEPPVGAALPGSAPGGGPGPAPAGAAPPSAANNPPSASSNPAFSSSESFENTRPQNNGSSPPVFDSRQKVNNDFAESVARSQSQRYPQVAPLQVQQQYSVASSSADDLPNTQFGASPLLQQGQPFLPQQQQFQQPQPAPQKTKQSSTRKLIKNILGGSTANRAPDPQQHIPPNSYDNTGGLARRPSKRVSNPPAIRTGASQVSLDQQQAFDWQGQGPHTQPSPLQGVEEFTDQYLVSEPQDLRLQNPRDLHPINTIRQVPGDADASPYSAEELAYHQQQGHIQVHGQLPPELQRQYSQPQVNFDPAQQHQFQFTGSPQGQFQDPNQPLFAGHLGNPQQQNPETVSQLSHESPITDSDQHTANLQSTATSPGVNYPAVQTQEIPRRPSQAQGQTLIHQQQQQQQQSMPLQQPGGPPPNRRSQDTDKGLRAQVDPPPGPPPGYRHSQAPAMSPLPNPPQGSSVGQNPNYRASGVQGGQQYDGSGGEQGRNSPQPSNNDRDPNDPEKAFKDLLTKYKNVKRLYFDGKGQIEQLNTQIEHLQNAVANQRMSQSRTSLDDNEYITRFNRLNGAINNLSFNIRKDWVTLPSWVDRFVSPEALKTGKQEMTAVGRAVISRWVFDEIFNRCFHPGLEPELSGQLKEIELNIRRFSYTMNSQEEFDALTAKVVGWRMATLEGLQRVLQGPDSGNHRADFTRRATSNLTAILFQHLTDPAPQGVEGSASMIVELAVGLAANIPLESRDVAIVYPLPMDPIQPHVMEVEKAGLPPLESRPSDASEGGGDAGGSDTRGEENLPKDGGGDKGGGKDRDRDRRGDKAARSGMLTTMLGGGPGSRKGSTASSIPSSSGADVLPPAAAGGAGATGLPPKDSGKVRLAGFVAVEVRGRQVLVKAPIWTLA